MQNTELQESFTNDNNTKDQKSLSDFVKFLKDGWRWIIASTFLCAMLGGAFLFLSPGQFEALASIEMASVSAKEVESASTFAEKLKLPLYYSDATFKACQIADRSAPGRYLAKELRPTVIKNTQIINIRFRAQSPADASRCLDSIFTDIRKNQSILAKPNLEIKHAQLRALQKKLEAAENLISQLPVKNGKFIFEDSKFSGSALLLATLQIKENETEKLRSEISDLQISLSEPQTKATSLVTPIYAPNIDVGPEKSLTLLASVFGGVLLGILLLAIKNFLNAKNFVTPFRQSD